MNFFRDINRLKKLQITYAMKSINYWKIYEEIKKTVFFKKMFDQFFKLNIKIFYDTDG